MAKPLKPMKPAAKNEASAPYNFVPLPEQPVPAPEQPGTIIERAGHDRYVAGRHTGWFDVVLTTQSPLFIRSLLHRDDFAKVDRRITGNSEEAKRKKAEQQRLRHRPEFFQIDGQLRIPGSSLHGMLRQIVEIASYGKFENVGDRKLYYRILGGPPVGKAYTNRFVKRQGDQRYKPLVHGGFIRKVGQRWEIEPCEIVYAWDDWIAWLYGASDAKAFYSGDPNDAVGPNAVPLWELNQRPLQNALVDVRRRVDRKGRFIGEQWHQVGHVQEWFEAVEDFALVPDPTHEPADEWERGTLVITGPNDRKKLCYVFLHSEPDDSPPLLELSSDVVDAFHHPEQLTPWQEDAYPVDQPANGCRDQPGGLRDGEPIFYLTDDQGEVISIGRARLWRLPYEHTIHELIPEAMRPGSTRNMPFVDLAEALFGWTDRDWPADKPKHHLAGCAGRVTFSDAVPDPPDQDLLEEHVWVPQILGSPKPTAIQLYLTQTDDRRRKAEAEAKQQGKRFKAEAGDRNYLSSYADGLTTTQLRGHKLYWHGATTVGQSTVTQKEYHGPESLDSQDTSMRPVKAHQTFRFRIDFHNLNDVELGALVWALHPRGEAGPYWHRLGMGKPLGLGSVELTATLHRSVRVPQSEVATRERRDRYARLFNAEGDGWATGEVEPPESLTDSATLARLTWPFEEYLTKEVSGTPGPLASLPRIADLLSMMHWPGSGQGYQSLEVFKRREVLPPP